MPEAVWAILLSELEARQKQAQEHPDCAWCLVEADEDLGEGSHGICEAHAEQKYQAWREQRGQVA